MRQLHSVEYQSNKIVLDNIIFALQKSGGVSAVWYELLRRLLENKKYNLKFIEQFTGKNIFRDRLKKDLPIENKQIVPLSIERYLPCRLKWNTPFVFHSSYYRICTNSLVKNITTVHDFTYELYRKGMARSVHSWQKYNAVKHSKAIVCVSKNTRNDLLNYYPDIDERNVRVIYNGVSKEYYVDDSPLIGCHFPSGSYLLFVGMRTGYKNFHLAIEAAATSGMKLVIVGAPLSKQEKEFVLKHLKENQFEVLTGISNNLLNSLYNHAYAFIYPSSYEGFGIPVIEAQKAGCPVIAMNRSSIPEIIGDTPLLINSEDADEIVSKIFYLKNEDYRKNIIEKGLLNSIRFSWDNMYEDYCELYNELLEK